MSKIDDYINLLFEIFGLTGWDKFGKEKARSTNYPRERRHWWEGIKKKPKYYQDWNKKNSKSN